MGTNQLVSLMIDLTLGVYPEADVKKLERLFAGALGKPGRINFPIPIVVYPRNVLGCSNT